MRDIERLRDLRARGPGGASLGAELERLRGKLEQEARRLGAAGAAWASAAEEGLGPRLASQTRPMRITRGVLLVEVANASVRYRVSGWLRGGGAGVVSRRAGVGKVADVKLVLARGEARVGGPGGSRAGGRGGG